MANKPLTKIYSSDVTSNICLPCEVAAQLSAIRTTTRQNQSEVITELLAEALRGRGIQISYPSRSAGPAPGPKAAPPPKAKLTKQQKQAAQALSVLQEDERQLSLVVRAEPVAEVSSSDPVAVTDVTEPAVAATTKRTHSITDAEIDEMFRGAGLGEASSPKPARDTRTDEEKGFKFLDPNAPLDLSILTEVEEEEDPNPFAGFTPPPVV